ncbi:MAG: glycosyltransferase, partial [Phycisphaeraceae bacterium]
MRIALDARNLYRPERRGIGKSLLELYRHLALVRPNWEVLAYHRQSGKLEPLLPEGFATPRLIEIPGDRFDAWSHLRLPLAARADRADVIHAPANQGPLWMPLPTVVTVHDLIPMEGPAADTAPGRRFTRGVRQACRRAAAITCPSSYTREQLVERLAADPERVWVTPWGAGPSPNLSVH